MHKTYSILAMMLACPLSIFGQFGQSTVTENVPVRMVVTLGHFYGKELPALTRDDVVVTQGIETRLVSSLVRRSADLELFILVDNCANCEVGTKFDELNRFIRSQPATTSVGIAYIQDGRLKIGQPLTVDREQAVKALSPPAGGKPSSPFPALTELITGWKADAARHVVLMITNGVDPDADRVGPNAAADAAIEAGQRAGVPVYAIYHPSADYLQGDFLRNYAGQTLLAHVSVETGGEAYFLTVGPLPSLGPFLADISDHLANEYVLTFLAKAAEQAGELQDISVKSKTSAFEIMAPSRVWIPGPQMLKTSGQEER